MADETEGTFAEFPKKKSSEMGHAVVGAFALAVSCMQWDGRDVDDIKRQIQPEEFSPRKQANVVVAGLIGDFDLDGGVLAIEGADLACEF